MYVYFFTYLTLASTLLQIFTHTDIQRENNYRNIYCNVNKQTVNFALLLAAIHT